MCADHDGSAEDNPPVPNGVCRAPLTTSSPNGPSLLSPATRAVATSSTAPRRKPTTLKAFSPNQVPDSILNDPKLLEALRVLPSNYNFEIPKTIWRIRRCNAKRVALQFPEGLLMFACTIADILEKFCAPALEDVVIMGDATYGSCCVDDYTARALMCDLLVHYGHSCLIPLQVTNSTSNSDAKPLQTLYVFVDISINVQHFVDSVKLTFDDFENTKLALVGTIQFSSSLRASAQLLNQVYKTPVWIPQKKPLSPGEILGCTSPVLPARPNASIKSSCGAQKACSADLGSDGHLCTCGQSTSNERHYSCSSPDSAFDAIVYLGDGRFHLESMMLSNPNVPAYRYDPYSKVFTIEKYNYPKTLELRLHSVNLAKTTLSQNRNAGPLRTPFKQAHFAKVAIILGTLGRQGNIALLERLEEMLCEKGIAYVVVLLSEVLPAKLELFDRSIEAWIQIACPRLSIDWGSSFKAPLLNPYEAMVAFGNQPWKDTYPMDYYSKDGGSWSVYYSPGSKK
ncbi:2-(3-amino-3-carboxypropyl)histidine synthase subunit 1-like [Schistocerca gregaria]|uniref:2-(3-amino-3-carboxypropyl)histidine synthase subunit 1-like n=1 Tax=Schistocerca gregaria TaxID=7010 RepID=UPI00211E9598|nr:2-(3-amino-3-carboxypropyl)histidine synthase subunit 1-like [Schistocerca gregaria]